MSLNVPHLQRLKSKRVVLASASPRRREIIRNLGLEFDVIPSVFPENLDKSTFHQPSDYVSETSKGKALEVYQRLKDENQPADIVIGVDTIVVIDDTILEKPGTHERALQMLKELRGRTHSVYTAVTLVYPNKTGSTARCFVEETQVEFANISDQVLQAYVDTGEPLDKAGGYGYQGLAAFFVKKINGDYWNVVGLPTCRLFQELETLCGANEI
ncbi:N-acetylserotonin O-methyltransferase-like protein-like protein [Umbelopsis sp. PMI_123]|nr:N-acetylserotonin O-methyltransferase-like protein-like protein [Umbelopsis sp. PMI_123]